MQKGRFIFQSQQEAYLRQNKRNIDNIWKRFYTELSKFIQELPKFSHKILIAEDFNDDIGYINSGMAKIAQK